MDATSRAREWESELATSMFPRSSWMHRLDLDKFDVLVVGAGLSGTVLADLYGREQGKRLLVVDRRPHIGGNCYNQAEPSTGVLVNLYGAHLFHTSKERVWHYVNRFSS